MGHYRKIPGAAAAGMMMMMKESSNNNNHQFAHPGPPSSICSCPQFLNPFPAANGTGNASYSPNLQHFCRVCNILLNSCRQAKIHADGKKHVKHLHYLKMCIESSRPDLPRRIDPPPPMPNNYPPGGPPPPPPSSSYPNAICQIQFSNCPSSACNAFLYHPMPPPPSYIQVPSYLPSLASYPSFAAPNYQDVQHHPLLQSIPPQMMPSPQQLGNGLQDLQHHHHQHLMSPSLTSGFGSGPDCKSTETSSILSATSFTSSANRPPLTMCPPHFSQRAMMNAAAHQAKEGSSWKMQHRHKQQQQQQPPLLCSMCHTSYPSEESAHQQGNNSAARHNNRPMTAEARKKSHVSLPNLGPENEIKCEVCQVSVNSSQQLVAHLAGQKHRIRAVRRGLKPDQAQASPSSSTLTSASASEHGGDRNDNNNVHQSKLRRRSSEFNLVRPLNGLRQRCYTTSGAGVFSLSRHLSSSCLQSSGGRACSRSTTSLRKAVSHTALNKCRSMNLLNVRRSRRLEEEELMQQPSWSALESSEEEGSDVEESRSANTSAEEYYRNQNFRQEKMTSNLTSKAINKSLATIPADPAAQCHRYVVSTTNAATEPSKIKRSLAKMKKHQPKGSNLSWKHSNYSGGGVERGGGGSGGGGGGGGAAPFKEIPMLNVFLQRLNQHSVGRKKNRTKQPLNESDFSNAENS